MIERMNKYLFVIYHKEYADFLRELRKLGVLHIKETKDKKKIASLEAMLAERKEVNNLMRRVKSRRGKDAPDVKVVIPESEQQGKAVIEEIEGKLNGEQNLQNQVASAKRELAYWEIWGDIDLANLEKLRKNGLPVRFFISPTSAYNEEWEERYGAVLINTFRAHNYFVTVGDFGKDKPDAEEIKAPTHTLDELQLRVNTFEDELAKTQQQIEDFANNRIGELEGYIAYIDKQYAFSNALLQATDEADNAVKVVEGWVPTANATAFEKALEEMPIYYEQLAIEENDDVPVKLKNNFYARLFEPITKLYSLPNYREIDITSLFAPFFMLFFALCFGDGGYGLLVLVIATIIKFRTQKQQSRDICSLMQWLGGTTAVVGSLMGTVFGMVMPWANDGSLLGSVRKDYFLNQDNLMYLSIALGFVQIIFGKFVAGAKVSKQKGFKYGLVSFAWGFVILAGVLGLIIPNLWEAASQTISYIFYGIAGLALLVALFYNSPDKNIIANFGKGLWDTYGTATGILGDVLSYIRLFAIGLTGGILGGVFNSLAVQMSEGLPIGLNFLVMALILAFGHSLNIGLCMISSLVHPLRLTFVEFYKNAEFEGGGKPYTPLD